MGAASVGALHQAELGLARQSLDTKAEIAGKRCCFCSWL